MYSDPVILDKYLVDREMLQRCLTGGGVQAYVRFDRYLDDGRGKPSNHKVTHELDNNFKTLKDIDDALSQYPYMDKVSYFVKVLDSKVKSKYGLGECYDVVIHDLGVALYYFDYFYCCWRLTRKTKTSTQISDAFPRLLKYPKDLEGCIFGTLDEAHTIYTEAVNTYLVLKELVE